jgi:hypothetical protein
MLLKANNRVGRNSLVSSHACRGRQFPGSNLGRAPWGDSSLSNSDEDKNQLTKSYALHVLNLYFRFPR